MRDKPTPTAYSTETEGEGGTPCCLISCSEIQHGIIRIGKIYNHNFINSMHGSTCYVIINKHKSINISRYAMGIAMLFIPNI